MTEQELQAQISFREWLQVTEENRRMRAALERIAALKVTGPNPIGPAHGWHSPWIEVAGDIARKALRGEST